MLTRDAIQGFLEKLQRDYATAQKKAAEAQEAVSAHSGALQAVLAILKLWDEEDKVGNPVLVADPPPKTPKEPPKD